MAATRLWKYGLLNRLTSNRLYSTKKLDKPQIALTDCGSTYVAWHPKEDFPYECTKPLPTPRLVEDTSVLKTQFTPELLSIIKPKPAEQSRLELMNMTNTTKHRWFPRARDRKAKKTPMDRKYL